MPDREFCRRLQMRLAADVGSEDFGWRIRGQRFNFVGEQALGQFGLQDGIGARRAAAQMRIRNGDEIEAEIGEQRLDLAFHLEAMLQRARRLERYAFRDEG